MSKPQLVDFVTFNWKAKRTGAPVFMVWSNVTCAVCGSKPLVDSQGTVVYFADPLFVESLDTPLVFCGAQHSHEWFVNNCYNRK